MNNNMKTQTKPIRVSFHENATDLKVLVMARLGQHTKAIASAVHLTPGQVQYRIMRGNCKGVRYDFRNGETHEFQWAYAMLRRKIAARILDQESNLG